MTGLKGLGARVKELRETRGYSKTDLARLVHVSPTAVWNWEENGLVPRHGTFSRLAKALEVGEAFLRTGIHGSDGGSGGGNGAPGPRDAATSATPAPSVPAIIEQARSDIAAATGMSMNKVQVNVVFLSS
jgi:DNA-binding XRE family transcriptional regulator